MNLSVTDPLKHSWNWMTRVLFKEFDPGKWLVLGFCAFLASLGRGGSNTFVKGDNWFDNDSGSCCPRFDFDNIGDFISEYLPIIMGMIVLIIALVFLGIALWVLMKWLSSRGKFMFLDGVVQNRGAVIEPWHRFKTPGNNLFIFRLVLSLSVGAVVIFSALLFGLIAWPSIIEEKISLFFFTALIPGLALIGLVIGVYILIEAILEDFIVPIMFRRQLKTGEAIRVFWKEILSNQIGTFVLFYALRIVLFILTAAIVLVGTCFTCCIAGLPYISSVVFLPIWVFIRGYSIYFLQQFGDDWQFISIENE